MSWDRTSVHQDAEWSEMYWRLMTASATNLVGYWNNPGGPTQWEWISAASGFCSFSGPTCSMLHLKSAQIRNFFSEIVTKWSVVPWQGQKLNFKTNQVIGLKASLPNSSHTEHIILWNKCSSLLKGHKLQPWNCYQDVGYVNSAFKQTGFCLRSQLQ